MTNPFDDTGRLYRQEIQRQEQEAERRKKEIAEAKITAEQEKKRILEDNLKTFKLYETMIINVLDLFGKSIWGFGKRLEIVENKLLGLNVGSKKIQCEYKKYVVGSSEEDADFSIFSLRTSYQLSSYSKKYDKSPQFRFYKYLYVVGIDNIMYIVGFQEGEKGRFTGSLVVASAILRISKLTSYSNDDMYPGTIVTDSFTFYIFQEKLINICENDLVEALKEIFQSSHHLLKQKSS